MALGRQGERQAELMVGWADLPRPTELWPKLGDGGVRKAAYRGG